MSTTTTTAAATPSLKLVSLEQIHIPEGGNPRKRPVPTRVTGETTEGTTAGPLQGVKLDTETLELDYLKACDWDAETCKPSKAKLEELGLPEMAAAL